MLRRFFRKKTKQLFRWARRQPTKFGLVMLIPVLALGYTSYISNQRLSVNPNSYSKLLSLIANAESRGNYNAYFGNAYNTKIKFTTMSIAEVISWQNQYVSQGSPSDAVGKYQIISPTLTGLVEEMDLSTDQVFDESTQDKLAMRLLERRGADSYVNNEINREQFAANLAKEWAALPRIVGSQPDKSYYAGDGLNKSLVDVDSVLEAIEPISAK